MRKYFGDTYHGGIVFMHWFGEYCHHQPFFWDWTRRVPDWLDGHLLRRLAEIEGYKANLEIDASSFEYLEARHPYLLERLREWRAAGKLEIVDGSYVQPYSYLQSGESCLRHFVYGQQAMKDVMGGYVKTYHKQEPLFFAQLPQILSKAGYEHAVLRLHITHYGACPVIERERMMWEAPDGSAIDTVPDYLDAESKYSFAHITENLPAYQRRCEKLGMASMLVTSGLDISHDIDYLSSFQTKHTEAISPKEVAFFTGEWVQSGVSDERIKDIATTGFTFVTLSDYFDREAPSAERIAPAQNGFPLYYKAGQLSDGMLRRGKHVERHIFDSEVFASMVRLTGGPVLLNESSRKAMWRPLLMSQNHDLHACPTSYSYSVAASPHNTFFELTDDSDRRAMKSIDDSLDYFCANVDSQFSGADPAVALVVFNQLPQWRRGPVETEVKLARGFAHHLDLKDTEGFQLPMDVVVNDVYEDGSIFKAAITFVPEIPAMGYSVCYLTDKGTPPARAAQASETRETSPCCLESEAWCITVGKNGLLTSVVERESGFDYLETQHFQGNELTVDFGDGLIESKNSACQKSVCAGKVSSTVTVEGGRLGSVPYRMKYRWWPTLERLDCETTLDFDAGLSTKSKNDEFSKFRVTFNPAFSGQLYIDEPFLVRPATSEVALGYNFASYCGAERWLTLVNQGNIGYFQNPEANTRLSLILAFGDPDYAYGPLLLWGVQTFRYSLFFGKGRWQPGQAVRQGLDVGHPFYTRQTAPRHGPLPNRCSSLGVEADSVVPSACYPCEEGVCLRLWETDGEMATVSPSRYGNARLAAETDLLGRTIASIDEAQTITFGPHEFKTLLMTC